MKRFYVLILSLVASLAMATPPTVTLTTSATTGQAPVSTTLTWSSTGASACSAQAVPANGQWAGTKSTSGSANITGIATDTQFFIACANDGDLNAVFTWIPPTLNTDGSALTDLAGYKIYECPSVACTVVANPAAPATSAQAGPFSAGLHTFQMTAINALGIESVPSGSVQKTMTAVETTTKNVAVTVAKKPAAPTNLVVQ